MFGNITNSSSETNFFLSIILYINFVDLVLLHSDNEYVQYLQSEKLTWTILKKKLQIYKQTDFVKILSVYKYFMLVILKLKKLT